MQYYYQLCQKHIPCPSEHQGSREGHHKWHNRKQKQPIHWKFICGIVVASITWSQTLLVFTIKPFSWGALFSSAPPGQQKWTLLGIIVKQGGSIKSTVVWLLDLDSLKIHRSGFFQPSYRLFSSEWEITSQTDVNTNNFSTQVELFLIESHQTYIPPEPDRLNRRHNFTWSLWCAWKCLDWEALKHPAASSPQGSQIWSLLPGDECDQH